MEKPSPTNRDTRPPRQSIRLSGFLSGLAVAGALAWTLPWLGARGGPLHTEFTTKVAVFAIFMLQGLALRTETIGQGLLAWKVHLFTQSWIFMGIPILTWLLLSALPMEPSLRIGFLFLAMLPTTISTSAVFTAQAGGSVTAALFNICTSNVAGVLIVPLWAAWLTHGEGETLPVLSLLGEIAVILIVPLFIGQLLRPFARTFVEARKRLIGSTTNVLILFIIFAAFSNSFASRIWEGRAASVVATGIIGAAILLATVSMLVALSLQPLGFSREEKIAAFFCGSQKTLAAGIPIAQSVFADTHLVLGIIVLPLMAYHLLQLIAGAFVSERVALTRA